MSSATDNLRDNQEQADQDGIMVKVSRQAVDEVLAEYDALRSALEPFVKAAETIERRPQDYRDRIVMIGGIANPTDVMKRHFSDALKAWRGLGA